MSETPNAFKMVNSSPDFNIDDKRASSKFSFDNFKIVNFQDSKKNTSSDDSK